MSPLIPCYGMGVRVGGCGKWGNPGKRLLGNGLGEKENILCWWHWPPKQRSLVLVGKPPRDMHQSSILIQMRTTLNLDDDLIRQAREFTGIQEKTALIHVALRELISRGAARRLAALGGTMSNFEAGRRRRPVDAR